MRKSALWISSADLDKRTFSDALDDGFHRSGSVDSSQDLYRLSIFKSVRSDCETHEAMSGNALEESTSRIDAQAQGQTLTKTNMLQLPYISLELVVQRSYLLLQNTTICTSDGSSSHVF